jgi:hypothetical protein
VKIPFLGVLLLIVAACASPRERAYNAAVDDYKRADAVVVDFARANVKQLVAATKAFHASVGHWPQTFAELIDFALGNKVPLDAMAFTDATFAALADGSVQVHYDVNCIRFSTAQYQFTQTGSVNVKAK